MEFLCKKRGKSGVECPQGKKCAPLHVTNMRSIRISASGGDDDRRRAFPPPRRWWQPCVTPYFADLGVGDMRGARASNIHRHPGGGGRLSVATKRLPSPPSWRQYQPGATPHRQCRERQRATPSAPSPLSFPRSSLTLPRRLKPAMLHYALLHHDTHPADSRR